MTRWYSAGAWRVAGGDLSPRLYEVVFACPRRQDRSRLPWEGDLLARRHALYQAAKAQHPDRGCGPTRNWEPATKVLLYPGNPLKTEHQTKATTA